jgi:hypothetical protein
MDTKKTLSPVFIIIAIILGAALLKQFDFQRFKFEKPALAVIYMIVFVFSVAMIIKRYRGK